MKHPVVELTSEGSWNFVRGFIFRAAIEKRSKDAWQVEDKFTPYGKETLAKLVTFLQVRSFSPYFSTDLSSLLTRGVILSERSLPLRPSGSCPDPK